MISGHCTPNLTSMKHQKGNNTTLKNYVKKNHNSHHVSLSMHAAGRFQPFYRAFKKNVFFL